MRRYKIFIGMALAGAMLIGGCAPKEFLTKLRSGQQTTVVLTTGFEADEVFRIGTSSCSLAEAKVYLTNMQNQYEDAYGAQLWERSIDGQTLQDKLKDIVLARIAKIKTMNLLAEHYNVTLSQQEEQKVFEAAERYYSSLNPSEIELMGADQETIEELYREYALAGKVYQTIIEDVNPEISDDEARTITVQTIFIKAYAMDAYDRKVAYTDAARREARLRAVTIRGKALDGEDFDSLVSQYNEGEVSRLSFGKGEVEQAVEEAAFNLGNDEISGIVDTEDGFYIIKCVSAFDRKETDANKEKIMEKRKKEAFNRIYDEFVASLLRNLNAKLWDDVGLSFDENVRTSTFFEIYNEMFHDPESAGSISS